MGTSTSYSAPPSWGDLKAEVTRAATSGSVTAPTAKQIVQHYIGENGGATEIGRRGGGIVGNGRTAQAVAGRLAGFISDVAAVGLDQALVNAGLAEFIGRPVGEILNGLIDKLGGPASTIDQVDARHALAELQDQLLGDATTQAEIEQILASQANQLEQLLMDFFGLYLFEHFCRVFFERLVQRVGEFKAESFLDEIKSFIASALKNRTTGRDLSSIAWQGAEGKKIITEIMETTLKVFGE